MHMIDMAISSMVHVVSLMGSIVLVLLLSFLEVDIIDNI